MGLGFEVYALRTAAQWALEDIHMATAGYMIVNPIAQQSWDKLYTGR